jgi:hypothetical protein
MTGFRSSNGYIGLEWQSVQGTAKTPTTFIPISAEEGIEQVQELLEVRDMTGDRELGSIHKVQHKPGGSFQTYARPSIGAELLTYVLGEESVSGSAAPYTHTITRADSIPYITVERKLDNIERFVGCKINQIVISGNTGQPVLMDTTFMASDSVIMPSAATASYETNEPFFFHDGVYTLDSGAIVTISAFTITINNNLEQIFTTGYKPNNLMEGPFDLEVTMRLKFASSDTLYPKVLFGSATALVDTLADGDFTVDLSYGASTTLRQLKFQIPYMKHLGITKHLDPATKAVYLDLRSKAYYSTSEIITVTAKNTHGSVYETSPSASMSPSSSASPSVSPSLSPSSSNSPSPSI